MRNRLNIGLAVFLLFITAACHQNDPVDYTPVAGDNIRIGALVALSGEGSSSGAATAASLELAATDIEHYFLGLNHPVRVQVEIADTRTDSSEALKQLMVMYQEGIRMVVGPYSSNELVNLRQFAGSHGMILVSPSGTASSLAIPGDNIFRLLPSDSLQGMAMGALLSDDKISTIVPLVRDDIWGNDLLAATIAGFGKRGGTVAKPVMYPPGTVDFTTCLASLSDAVSYELTHHNPNEVAVCMLSFTEGTRILALAGKSTVLNNVYWYGASAFAGDQSVIEDTVAAFFAYTHGLPCPQYALEEDAGYKWEPLVQRISDRCGKPADIYSIAAYDALWLLVKSYVTASGSHVPWDQFGSILSDEAGDFFGATGNTRLDANGDRATGNYDFRAVKRDSTGYCWKTVARYNTLEDIIIRP